MIKDLTEGSVAKQLFMFAMPLFVANALQAVYNLVDMVVVGQVIGGAGMSAVSIGAGDGSGAVALAEEGVALGEEVESTLGHVHLQTWDVLGEGYDEVTAALKGLPHLFDALLALDVCGQRSHLADGAWSAGVLSL